jgi:hypothetical protein
VTGGAFAVGWKSPCCGRRSDDIEPAPPVEAQAATRLTAPARITAAARATLLRSRAGAARSAGFRAGFCMQRHPAYGNIEPQAVD